MSTVSGLEVGMLVQAKRFDRRFTKGRIKAVHGISVEVEWLTFPFEADYNMSAFHCSWIVPLSPLSQLAEQAE